MTPIELKNKSLLKTQAYINGQWTSASDNKTFEVTNPYSGEVIAQVADCGVEETRQAIAAANEAFAIWKNYSAGKRSRILRKWYELQLANSKDLGKLLTIEQGKPLPEAIGEIRYGASFVEWFAEEAKRVYGDVIPAHGRDKRIVTIKQPIGVVGAITPWNFPSAMITRKVAPALAAGCTVVIKPAELTPLSALALAELAEQAGFPPGVFNIITTNNPAPVGMELTKNKTVRKISFTGSTEVGKLLLKQSADTVKRVSMELGGNAPFIVFDDADIDAAVEGAIGAKFRNAGQTCICANRIFVQENIYEEFAKKLTEKVRGIKTGNGLEEGIVVGPMIEDKALQFVQTVVSDAVEHGAAIQIGGKADQSASNLIFQPTVLTDVSTDSKAFNEEIFGPIAPLFKFSTEAEAIQLANNTDYGLAAYFYGRDYARIWRVAEALEYGMVGINTGMISTPVAPFGGIKESGMGREGSKYGMDDYLEIKYMCFGGL